MYALTTHNARVCRSGSVEMAGDCHNDACLWFSQPATISGEPTLPDYARTMHVNVTSGPDDFSRTMPWRAPGTAPVYGSGCGVAGGGPVSYDNGGNAPDGYNQGDDFLTIPEHKPAVWQRGGIEEVAFAISANHGGGYSWRLCKKNTNVSEACFGQNTLEFYGGTQWIRYTSRVQNNGKLLKLPDFAIQAVRVSEGTHPPGSHWSRNPVPPCNLCDQSECMQKHPSKKMGDDGWDDQQHCSQSCSGLNVTSGGNCPPGLTQFPEPAPGISGYLNFDGDGIPLAGLDYSIVDKVVVPKHIEPGEYLLSWRWE
eukprot:COSAG05_NODE_470_length_9504_cov_260.657629_7_plen_311_part_00